MRRHTSSRLAVAAFALAMLGAPCSTTGPGPRDFEAGALVVPMDNCYQRRNGATANQTVACNTGDDDGVFRAYGLVYFLLQKGVTVYWAIDGAELSAKTSVTGVDLVVPAPTSGAVVRKYDWTSRSLVAFAPAFPAATGITYIGGPFVIDAADKARVLDLLANDPDIAKVRNRETVDIHEVQVDFHANQVRPLSGTPPRLAILGINPKPYHKTSFDVMYRYAVAAGFDWPCNPASGDCAGGLGAGCDATVVQRYLADTLCATASNPNCADRVNECYEGCGPNWVAPDITGAQFNPPGVPGKVYDVLCDADFTGNYADSTLGQGGYKLLWAPHWDTAGFDPTSATGAGATLGQQLRNISAFVQAGNNLFAECAAIGAFESGQINGSSGARLRGLPETHFHATAGMVSTTNATSGTVLSPFLVPPHPNLQIGDFAFSLDGGAITKYYPDRAASPASLYRPGVERLITSTVSGSTVPWDLSGTRQVTTSDGVKVGTVAYLGGHDYSPSADGTTDRGQTAGTRIVLNTLFNLGFACADPNTTCQVEGVPSNSACALGVLKCSGAGGFTCVPNVRPGDQAEACGNGVDDDCDGTVDEGCAGTCTPASTRSCDGGAPPAQICVPGTQTCSAVGIWGACEGLRLKSPEACNGVDDDCDGTTDEGTICPFGQSCTGGVCLPQPCDLEVRCPGGYTCTGVSPASQCEPNPCVGGAPCPAGRVCSAGACVDPCASVTCGPGSTCSGGVCFGGACYTSGCPQGQLCQQGQCLADPCAGLTCPQGTFCRAGACVRSCAGVTCADGQHCGIDGFCEPGPACPVSCGSGQVCQGGQCVADPACGGVGCGQGQVCRGGSCVDDPCSGVTCPAGACQGGQCTGGTASSATVPKEPGTKSGCGCGSAGGLDLLGLAAGLALWPRLRRAAPRRGARQAVRRTGRPGLAVALALALGASACGGKTAAERCPTASTPCGTLCCASGYSCQAGSCVFGTQNPVVLSLSPSRAGVGSSVTLTLTGEGFQSGAVARLTGAGLPAQAPLDVTSATSATLILDLSQAAPGIAEVRVVNPADHLSSNAATLSLTSDPVPVGVSPTSVRQDAAAPLDVRVSGSAFGSGLVVTLSKGATSLDLAPVAVSAQEATVQLAPASLAIGVYDVTVRFPGGNVSPAVKLAVVEGTPVTTGMTPGCAVGGTSFVGALTGSFLYPSSTVYVSGGVVPDSPLITRCAQATPAASGQCQGGQLEAVVDLSGVANGDYQVWVVNPGAPALTSTPKLTFRVASACP